MKTCPTCSRKYTDPTLTFCLDDGTRLLESYDSAATLVNPFSGASNSEATLVNPFPRDTDPAARGARGQGAGFDDEATRVRVSPAAPSEPTLVVKAAPPAYAPPPPTAPPKRFGSAAIIIAVAGVLVLAVVGLGVGGLVLYTQSGTTTQNSNNRPRETPTATPRPTAKPTPETTPQSSPDGQVSVTGQWVGTWTNSLGNSGSSTITVLEMPDGTITGGEGDEFVMMNGRREGNVLSWNYVGVQNGCLDYSCQFEFDETGTQGQGSYTVTDSCKDSEFSGTYDAYAKQ
ncbi:MAG: hypothetical protein ABIP75_18460 [Pyrinomonadaceae bacterium]